MGETSLNDFNKLINQQIEWLEDTNGYHAKIKSLLSIALNADPQSYKESTLHDFLWVLDEMVESAQKVTGDCINSLVRNGWGMAYLDALRNKSPGS